MNLNDEKRGIEEAYQVAGNTSDLRVEPETRGDADLIIAAGWSPSRVGMALLRLHSEWDRAEKPRKPSLQAVEALARQYTPDRDGKVQFDAATRLKPIEAAKRVAHGWYMDEMAKLINKLGSLPSVRAQLIAYVPKWGIKEAGEKVPAVIAYWLDQTCRGCHGLKFRQIEGSPSLSTKMCRACGGSGVALMPDGHAGQEWRRVANYMDDCCQKARESIKVRLRQQAVAAG